MNGGASNQQSLVEQALMQPSGKDPKTGIKLPSTNRQANRFADAYLEPEYESIKAINKTMPKPSPINLLIPVVLPTPPFYLKGNMSAAQWNTFRANWPMYVADTYAAQQKQINDARDSLNHKPRLLTDTFWVVYITDAYRSPSDPTDKNIAWGWTFPPGTDCDLQASAIFSQSLIWFFRNFDVHKNTAYTPPAAEGQPESLVALWKALQANGWTKGVADGNLATAMVTVHEVAHQLLNAFKAKSGRDANGHHNSMLVDYWNAPNVGDGAPGSGKADPNNNALPDPYWTPRVSVMIGKEGVGVPWCNLNQEVPPLGDQDVKSGANMGPFDMFYFDPRDIADMRKRVSCPGPQQ